MAPLSRLDHVVVGVRNLDEAAATYRKLGFALTPRGLHEGKGTGNHCIMFANTYVELLGVVDPTGAQGRLAGRVASRGEGAIAIAYGADDADIACAALRQAGIEAEDPNDLARPLDLDGTRAMVRFRNVMMPGLKLSDTMQFVCTHQTPALTRARREWQLHPSDATDVVRIIVAHHGSHDGSHDGHPDIAAEFGALFGPARATGELDNATIAVDSRDRIEKTFGSNALNGAPSAGIVGLVIRINEVDAVSAMLEMGRVPHRDGAHGVVVPASAAHGVFLVFAED